MIFIGTFVDCPRLGDLEIYHDYILNVDEDTGVITDFVPRVGSKILEEADAATCRYLPKYSFLLPTFSDLHLHAPQTLYLGTGLHLPLLQWLDMYAFKAEERIDNDLHLAAAVYTKLATRLVQNGTGAVLLFGTLSLQSNLLLASIFQEKGLRAFVGKLSMDISTRPTYVEPDSASALRAALTFINDCRALVADLPPHQRRVHPVITPRFVPTCSDTLLADLGALAQQSGAMVQSHLAEAHDQASWVRRTRGADDLDVFARSGLLTPRTIQAHCTYLPATALSLLQEHGTAIAHCPLSNAYFSDRPFPLREALDRGVHVGLGTDVAGGYDLDIMSAMRSAVLVSKLREGARRERIRDGEGQGQREDGDEDEDEGASGGGRALDVSWKEALYMATTAGARALHLRPDGGGSAFRVGMPFDAQQIDLYDDERKEGIGKLDFFEPPSPRVSEDMVEKWWCLGDPVNRSAVYIQGKNIL